MRTFTFKGLFLTAVFMLLGCSSLYAADDDLITRQITIKLDKAGTLPDKIGSSRMYKITNLKLVGEINGTDWKMIREMAGINYNGYSTEGKLSTLDLSEAKIVKGGYAYSTRYYTSNDEIGDYAFYNCRRLTSLNLPSSITSIGESAFENCSGLTSLNLPAGITSIGGRAFENCSGLTSLNLPAGITSIDYNAFYGCSGLTSLNLPDGITEIDKYAFYGCSGLTSLTLPASITTIGDYAFYGCSGLKEVNFCINDDLETYLAKGHVYINVDCDIKYYLNDKEITSSIVIPSNVTSLGHFVLQNCSGLTSVTLPTGITEIGGGAFYNCRGLTSLNLPACITSIGGRAFYGCSGLTSLTIPDGVTKIGVCTFSNCSYLTSLTIPSSVNFLGGYAFQECTNLQSVYVSWQNPISAGSAFYGVNIKNCTLYVPQGTEQDYFLADVWGDFGNIVEFDATGIDKPTTSTDVEEVSRYSVNGQRLVGPTKGLNIVKYSDGSVKKVVVQ